MKKVIIILLSVFMLSGCDMVQSIVNYFVDIEPSKIEGTENTEFIFKANTNDIVDQWIIDGGVIPANTPRIATIKNKLEYSFSSGTHIIGVLTNNGATDEVEINVTSVETVFNLSAITRENTTEFYLDYPLLEIDGTEYDIETSDSLDILQTENQNIIYMQISVDFEDSFIFVNNNAFSVYEIDLAAVTISQMNEIILMFFPERSVIQEPYYSETRFNLSGYNGSVSDHLLVFNDKLNANGIDQFYVDNAVYIDDLRNVSLTMIRDNKDSFLFINNNMVRFFNIDLSNMSMDELIITADVLNRYPEETVFALRDIYNP